MPSPFLPPPGYLPTEINILPSQARKGRGCDLAFIDPIEVTVEDQLPGGGKDSVKIRVASLVTFLVMKGMALDDRLKEKDAWDIIYYVRNYPGGLDALVDELKPHLKHGLVREGLQKIEKYFASASHVGPTAVAAKPTMLLAEWMNGIGL